MASINRSNLNLFAVAAACLTLISACDDDDDPSGPDQPSVQWSVASQTSAENVATVTVTAQLSESHTSAVSVPFTLSGTGATPADFTVTASPLTIAAGQTSASATITVVDDTDDEQDETIILTIGTPTNATKGTRAVQTVTITDNDPTP